MQTNHIKISSSVLRFLFFLGCICFAFTHFWNLSPLPGLHYDEAWAANYAFRIASDKNFWPLTAMSPYTAPWAHYGAAFFFKIFGVSVLVFRASQVFFAALGVFLTSVALKKKEERVAAALLPLFIAFFPVLVMNHRFAIEMNGFHVFCFGLLLYGIAAERVVFVVLAALLGVTAHVLFLAQLFAILLCILLFSSPNEIGRRWRFAIVGIALALIPFFLQMASGLPSAGKAYTLIFASLFISIFFGAEWRLLAFLRQKKNILLVILALTSFPFLCNLLFFSESTWSILLTHGVVAYPLLQMLYVLPIVVFFLLLRKINIKIPGSWIFFFLSSTLFAGLMMLKPAPRYFELPLFCFAILILLGLSRLPRRIFFLMFLLFCGLGFTSLSKNYGLVHEVASAKEQEFHFLFYKDSSRDFLAKQKLTRYLGLKGCNISAIVSGDGRVLEALHFLAHGDWPVAKEKICDGPWRVDRLRGDIRPAVKPEWEVFGFGLWKESSFR